MTIRAKNTTLPDPPVNDPAARAIRRSNVTLADVARLAGVSTITASRALSRPDMVTEKTRIRVREAVVSSGYMPNLIAGSLRSKRTRLIACLVPTLAPGSAFLVAVQSMTKTFAAAGYQVMLGERGYDPTQEETLVDAIVARRPDGIVIAGLLRSERSRQRLLDSQMPIMEMWDMTSRPLDMVIGFSHEEAGATVARYFHGLGRRRPAMITTLEPRGEKRAAGFVKATIKAGLIASAKDLPTYAMEAPSRMKHGRQGLAHLMATHPDIDAVYCASDLIGMGALIEARVQGIDVPGRIAVVGFGDLDFANDTDPPLTTVHVDSHAIGQQAALCVVDRVENGGTARIRRDLGVALVKRDSA